MEPPESVPLSAGELSRFWSRRLMC